MNNLVKQAFLSVAQDAPKPSKPTKPSIPSKPSKPQERTKIQKKTEPTKTTKPTGVKSEETTESQIDTREAIRIVGTIMREAVDKITDQLGVNINIPRDNIVQFNRRLDRLGNDLIGEIAKLWHSYAR
jgi:hypothetical protein